MEQITFNSILGFLVFPQHVLLFLQHAHLCAEQKRLRQDPRPRGGWTFQKACVYSPNKNENACGRILDHGVVGGQDPDLRFEFQI